MHCKAQDMLLINAIVNLHLARTSTLYLHAYCQYVFHSCSSDICPVANAVQVLNNIWELVLPKAYAHYYKKRSAVAAAVGAAAAASAVHSDQQTTQRHQSADNRSEEQLQLPQQHDRSVHREYDDGCGEKAGGTVDWEKVIEEELALPTYSLDDDYLELVLQVKSLTRNNTM